MSDINCQIKTYPLSNNFRNPPPLPQKEDNSVIETIFGVFVCFGNLSVSLHINNRVPASC